MQEKKDVTSRQPYEPPVKKVRSSEVRDNWGDILPEVARGGLRVIVERRGRETVAILSANEYRRYVELSNNLLSGISPEEAARILYPEIERDEHLRAIEDKQSTIDEQAQTIADQSQIIEENARATEERQRIIDELSSTIERIHQDLRQTTQQIEKDSTLLNAKIRRLTKPRRSRS